MKEIEVKILEIDVEKTEKKLKEMGAEKVFSGELINTYFDFPDKRLEKEGKILRLRKKGDKVILTYKKMINREKAKIMDEHELEVQDFELLKSILKEVSLFPIYEFKKHRTTYELNKINFEIDEYSDIPAFLEIEAPDLETINEMVAKLGFSREEANSYSIKEVLEYYDKK
ncbi:MAG: class IV adenylate cyclase [candidate division WOR-3 bacterium]